MFDAKSPPPRINLTGRSARLAPFGVFSISFSRDVNQPRFTNQSSPLYQSLDHHLTGVATGQIRLQIVFQVVIGTVWCRSPHRLMDEQSRSNWKSARTTKARSAGSRLTWRDFFHFRKLILNNFIVWRFRTSYFYAILCAKSRQIKILYFFMYINQTKLFSSITIQQF